MTSIHEINCKDPAKPFYEWWEEGNCRAADDNAECGEINPRRPFLNSNRICVTPSTNEMCYSVDQSKPIFDTTIELDEMLIFT